MKIREKGRAFQAADISLKLGGSAISAASRTVRTGVNAGVNGDDAQDGEDGRKSGQPKIPGGLSGKERRFLKKLPQREQRKLLKEAERRAPQERNLWNAAGAGSRQERIKRMWKTSSGGAGNAYPSGWAKPQAAAQEAAGTASCAEPVAWGTGSGAGTAAGAGSVSQGTGTAAAAGGTAQGAGASAAGAGSAAAGAAAGAATGGAAVAAGAAISAGKKSADKIKEALASMAERREAEAGAAAKDAASGAGGKGRDKESPASSFTASMLAGAIALCAAALVPLLIACAALSYFLFDDAVYEETDVPAVVQAAEAELIRGDENIGGLRYKLWYGLDDNWCAMFVSYCADRCGYIDEGIMPLTASVSEMEAWYEERGLFHSTGSGYTPAAGDIIFFGNGMSHVGIVTAYDAEAGTVTVIEGNSGPSDTDPYHEGSTVLEAEAAVDGEHVTGFASPEYPDPGKEE